MLIKPPSDQFMGIITANEHFSTLVRVEYFVPIILVFLLSRNFEIIKSILFLSMGKD